MKRRTIGIIAATALAGILLLTVVSGTFAMGRFGTERSGPSPTPATSAGSAGNYGPGGYGPGGMMGSGYGPSSGFGSGYGPGMMGGWSQGNPNQPAISIDQAQQDVQAYVNQTGNPDLTLDEVMEFQNNFYAIVKEKSTGIGAFEVLINKWTGAVTWEPQSMMWNTKYGMMGQNSWMGQAMGYTVPTGPMTVSADQAKQFGQKWLDQYQPGSTTEVTPDTFYGYYTMHTMKNGQITGMLSVNGYTGQVWYHSWHGAYIQMKSLDG